VYGICPLRPGAKRVVYERESDWSNCRIYWESYDDVGVYALMDRRRWTDCPKCPIHHRIADPGNIWKIGPWMIHRCLKGHWRII
jgi:hypothetical protein